VFLLIVEYQVLFKNLKLTGHGVVARKIPTETGSKNLAQAKTPSGLGLEILSGWRSLRGWRGTEKKYGV